MDVNAIKTYIDIDERYDIYGGDSDLDLAGREGFSRN